MEKKLTLTGKKCAFFILYFTIIMEILIAEFHFPSFIRYLNDIMLILAICMFMRLRFINVLRRKKGTIVTVAFILLVIICLSSAVINFVPVRLVIWAFRNTFRGILYFFVAITFFDNEDLNNILKNIYYIQFINVILASYQFFILHHNMDGVGGIFGYGNGAGVNIFNALVMSFIINGYIEGRVELRKVVITVLCSFYVAGIAEEKMTYVLFVIVLLCAVVLSKSSLKKIAIVLIGIIGIILGLRLLYNLYPDMFRIMTNIDEMINYLSTTYDEGYRLPRIGAFPIISKIFFRNNANKLLGLGFGNCEYSVQAIFCSEFYKKYGDLNYRWFVHQWTFLETGYLGFYCYVFLFIAIIIGLVRYRSICKIKLYNSISITMACCCICTIWYNATLKVDMSYLAFFSMSIGYIYQNDLVNRRNDVKIKLGGE